MATDISEPKGAHRAWTTGLEWAFVDGDFIRAAEAGVSVHAHALSYGTGTFEGIRASWNEQQEELYLLEPKAHYERMSRSANVLGLSLPFKPVDLVSITVELLRRNDAHSDTYVRPLYLLAGEELSVRMHDVQPRFSLAASAISGRYLTGSGGARCMVSSWRRPPDVSLPSRAKLTGSYVGPAMAKTEAIRAGFDEAIMLNSRDRVAEGTTSNLFLRRASRWFTPGANDDILEGITRGQVMTLLAEETGEVVIERSIDRSELYICDELLLCGTAAQIVPVVEVDSRRIGDGVPGQVTVAVSESLDAISRRQDNRHLEWTVPVYNGQGQR